MMNKNEKQKLVIDLISNHLNFLDHDFSINETNAESDISLSETGKQIKLFCNFSRLKKISLPKGLELKEGILYLVVTPTDRNNVGFIACGGTKDEIEGNIELSDSPKLAPKLLTEKLKSGGIRTYLNQ